MGKHEYKKVDSYFSFKRRVRKVQRLEEEGWELVSVVPILAVMIFGGGTGYSFVLKRQLTDGRESQRT